MGTGAALEEAEAVAKAFQLRAERVGHGRLEPADHPGATAGQDDPGLPGLAQDRVESLQPPDCEHVRRVAAGYDDHVLCQRELAEVGRRPGEELDVGELAASFPGLVEATIASVASPAAVGTKQIRGFVL